MYIRLPKDNNDMSILERISRGPISLKLIMRVLKYE